MVTIRLAKRSDVRDILDIYNEAVVTTTATFDIVPRTYEQQTAWYDAHDSRHPITIAEIDGAVVGWASLSEWSSRCAYRATAETTFYVKEGCRGQGIGSQLMVDLLERARQLGFHTLVAQITDGSDASVRIHERHGFRHVGDLKEVGEKFSQLLNVHIYQKIYDAQNA